MKVKFLKQHLSYKEGGVYEVTDGLGEYLISVKAAKKVSDDTEVETKEKKEVKAEKPKEKVSKAGPNAPKKKKK
jgi:hypothetical protein